MRRDERVNTKDVVKGLFVGRVQKQSVEDTLLSLILSILYVDTTSMEVEV